MTGMVHSTGNFPELLWPGIMSIFGEKYDDWETIYTQVFKTDTSDKAFEKIQQVTNFPKAVVKEEGGDIKFETLFQGYQKEFYHFTYGIGGAITREMFEDDQYGYIKRIPEFLARSMRETEEVVAHNIFNTGFSSTGADGVALYSTAHPLTGTGDTLSNTPSTAADLTQTSLENALIDIGNWTDDQGNKINGEARKILVPVALQFQVKKILETQYAVGSADNDKNILATMNLMPCVSPYVTDSDSWFIITNQDGLQWFTRREAELVRENEFDTQNLKMALTKRFSVGCYDFRSTYASPGA